MSRYLPTEHLLYFPLNTTEDVLIFKVGATKGGGPQRCVKLKKKKLKKNQSEYF